MSKFWRKPRRFVIQDIRVCNQTNRMHRNIHSEAKSTNKDGLTIYTKKLGQIQKRSPMLGSKEKIRTSEPNSVEEITLTSHKLCEDYIHARLRRSGISDFDLASALSQTDCSMTLQSMGKILELRYPKLFSKISVHLRITYSNEAVVLGAFNKFAANLFIDGITWARIVALFAFAGGLAVDCTAHGRAIFLGRIGYWLAAFVAKNLSEWIKQHGGWVNINII